MQTEKKVFEAPGALPPIPKWAEGEVRAAFDAYGREAWTMGLDVGMRDAPAADETTLPDLARLLGTASKEGKDVKLSAVAAGTLYNAMTTAAPPVPAPVSEAAREGHVSLDEAMASGELQQLKTEARALAADGGNWSMDVGCMFVLAMIDRIEASAADVARLDFVLDNSVFICTIDHGMYQLMTQDADEEYHVMSGEGEAFKTKRAAVDAAMLAAAPIAGSAT